MLVLFRKRDERIVIRTPGGEVITVVVVEFKEGDSGRPYKVRLGIDAPSSVRIDREEIDATKQREQR